MKECNQCGKCCIKYGNGALAATAEEIDLWELFNPEIFEYVRDNEIWVDPKTGVKLKSCPFLEVEPKKMRQRPTNTYAAFMRIAQRTAVITLALFQKWSKMNVK